MAKDDDFITRPVLDWVISLYNNSPKVNNVTKSSNFNRW